MATTTLKTRIQHKYNTPAKWAEDTSFVPLKGEICIFNNGAGVKPEMKIGDGTTTLANLPFLKAGGDMAISRSLTSGTKIATITIDGVATDLYCQTNTDTTYSAGTGLSLSGTTFSLNVAGAKTALGLGSNAYSSTAYIAQSFGGTQYITNTASSGDTSLCLKTNAEDSWLGFDGNGTTLGWIGFAGEGDLRVDTTSGVYNILHSGNYNSYAPTKTGSGASGTWGINITGSSASCTGNAATATTASSSNWLNTNSALTYGASGLNYFNASLETTASATSNYGPTADWYHIIRMNHYNAGGYYVDLAACFHHDNLYLKRVANGTNYGYKHIWVEGNSITGAVWNDYAEYRESDCAEFGRVLTENGDDTLSLTTERLQHFAGISSDTWGFCQGETEKAKTPIAVAGRVLAYTYRNRNEYKPGDCVCAAPNGTVDIMTREEIEKYPDRIVGTVSCVPEYEEWGQGDRPVVKVDGRIWVKVR